MLLSNFSDANLSELRKCTVLYFVRTDTFGFLLRPSTVTLKICDLNCLTDQDNDTQELLV